MKRNKYFVQPDKNLGWELKFPDGHKKAFERKSDAVEKGRNEARNSSNPSQLIIQLSNRRIQTEHTYQNDPRKYKG